MATGKVPLVLVKPKRPISEMTETELEELASAMAAKMRASLSTIRREEPRA